jgi:hypothetical protein
MPVADFAQHVQAPFFAMNGRGPAAARPAAPPATTVAANSSSDASKDDGKSFFDNLLDIINPLQHIPVVSTIYGALTGDKIGPFEQIAGDTLYGGVTGLAMSIAGEAFTQATGKSIGDTVLALFKDDNSTKLASAATYLVRPADAQTDVASATPAAPHAGVPYSSYSPEAATAVAANPATQALTASLKRNNVDADLALRASYAYRQAVAQLDSP